MTPELPQAQIFLPMLALVALSVIGFVRLFALRFSATKARAVKLSYYRAFQGDPEPAPVAAAARHYNNLFEAPVLFYAGCIVAYVMTAVTPWFLVFAWGYVAARVVQSIMHLTHNNVLHRGYSFGLGWLFLIALWIDLGVAIVARA